MKKVPLILLGAIPVIGKVVKDVATYDERMEIRRKTNINICPSITDIIIGLIKYRAQK